MAEQMNQFAEILHEALAEEQNIDLQAEEEKPTEDVVEEEETEEEVEESEEESEEAAPEEGESEEESEDLEEPPQEDIFPENLDDLAEAFEVDLDKIKDVKVALKKDGTPVTLNQVLQNWDVSEAVNRKSQELSTMKQQLEQYGRQYYAETQEKLLEQATVLDALEQLYVNNGKAELDSLRESDPAEYAARRAELDEQRGHLETVKEEVRQEVQQLQQQQEQARRAGLAQRLANEQEQLFTKAPEFKDKKKYEADAKAVVDFLKTEGYTEQELNSIVDHRVLLIARDAMRYRNMDKTANTKKKRVVRKPKSIRSSTTKGRQTAKEKSLDKVLSNAAKSSDNRVKQDAIAQLLRSL